MALVWAGLGLQIILSGLLIRFQVSYGFYMGLYSVFYRVQAYPNKIFSYLLVNFLVHSYGFSENDIKSRIRKYLGKMNKWMRENRRLVCNLVNERE